MVRNLFAAILLFGLSGCATTAVLNESDDTFNNEAHRDAVIAAAVVTDVIVTPLIVADSLKEAKRNVVDDYLLPIALTALLLNAINNEVGNIYD